jgi:hypothetical protein
MGGADADRRPYVRIVARARKSPESDAMPSGLNFMTQDLSGDGQLQPLAKFVECRLHGIQLG